MKYLIFSKKHTRGIAMWWRPNAAGYTDNLDAAGRYSKEEAESYCAGSHGEDVPIPERVAYDLPARRVIDLGDGSNHERLLSHGLETAVRTETV